RLAVRPTQIALHWPAVARLVLASCELIPVRIRCSCCSRLSPDGRSVAPVAASAARVIITCCVVELIWIPSALFGVFLLFDALRCCLRNEVCFGRRSIHV